MSGLAGFLAGLNGGLDLAQQREAAEGGQRRKGILEWLGLRDPASPQGPRGDERIGGEVGARAMEGRNMPVRGQTGTGPNTRIRPSEALQPAATVSPAAEVAPRKPSTGSKSVFPEAFNYDPRLSEGIAKAESEHGLPSGYLSRIAWIESKGKLGADNPNSSASGPFQFVGKTAKAYGLADPTDPLASSEAVGRFTRDNVAALRRSLGRAPSEGEMYLAHQQGAGGASALLANADKSAVDVLTPIYDGNRDLALKAVRNNGGRADMTAGDFAALWTSKFDGAGEPAAQAEPDGFESVRQALGKVMRKG